MMILPISAFQEYLQKVENWFSACGEQHVEWLSEHKESIAAFRDKAELVLAALRTRERSQQTGEDDALSECSWKTNSSSVRFKLKLAEEKADAISRQEHSQQLKEMK